MEKTERNSFGLFLLLFGEGIHASSGIHLFLKNPEFCSELTGRYTGCLLKYAHKMYIARIAARGGYVTYCEIGARQQMLGVFHTTILNVGCNGNTEKAFI